MSDIGELLVARIRSSLPGSRVYWEREPVEGSLDGAVLSAQYRGKIFTLQFERGDESAPAAALDDAFLEQVVDDFSDFFSRTIYPKEKFTRII